MPRKNKRKFFGGKSNKSKTVKLNEEDASKSIDKSSSELKHQSDSDEDNSKRDGEFKLRKSAVHASTSSVTNDSTIGHLKSGTPETNATKMGGTLSSTSPRWCSEPNLTNNSAFNRPQRATIQLKIIQFINPTTVSQKICEEKEEEREEEENCEKRKTKEEENDLHEAENVPHAAGAVPKLDHYKEDEANEPQHKQQRFDDNYRVESPKQISSSSHDEDDHHHLVDDENRNRLKRHAMLIQEISESSSSEEVRQFLDNEACAIEMKAIDKTENMVKSYRVESPASSDDYTKADAQSDDNLATTVHEICESSSSESVTKGKEQQVDENTPKITTLNLKIINIQELPSEHKNTINNNNINNNNNHNKSTTAATSLSSSPKAKIKLFECKSEKKLNKAEEAIIEALYGNSNLLQIPNTPLDVISEEGSDCNSDIDIASKLHIKTKEAQKRDFDDVQEEDDDDDDDVFLKTPNKNSSTVTSTSRFRHKVQHKRTVAEEPMLINTKLIEIEMNVPESCKKWETKQSDSELQAELVYLPSTSSSATDLSERSNTDTEEVEEDTSEDTETNSILENISVPSLTSFNITSIQTSAEQELELLHPLTDILEEEEETRSIIESQQQIEDVNKELHHLVDFSLDHKELQNAQSSDDSKKENIEQEEKEVAETSAIACDEDDKKLIGERQVSTKSETPTPTQCRRKYSSDSSTSSSNSQCTIIRQIMPIEGVHALKDLCMRSLPDNGEGKVTVQKRCNSLSRNAPNIPIINELELHYECDNDDLQGREKDKVITILQVPPEMSSNQSNGSGKSSLSSEEKKRWFGMQSSQIPNLMVALSPSQKDYMMSSHESNNTAPANVDVLLDMHKKFVERRAYHETSDDDSSNNKNSGATTSRLVNILRDENLASECQLEDSNRSNNGCSKISSDESAIKLRIVESDVDNDSSNSCSSLVYSDSKNNNNNNSIIVSHSENKQESAESGSSINNMNTLRSLILRERFFNVNNEETTTPESVPITACDEFKVKKNELENELMLLDYERKELEEELRNIQSLQHFKREEFLYNQRKIQKQKEKTSECNDNESQTRAIETNHKRHSMTNGANNHKYVNDDFSDFINSNEKLHQEIFNEWQDKVLERNERKLQKTLKITTVNEITRDEREELQWQQEGMSPLFRRERAASERIIKLNDEFLARVKERQKRLSLPLDDNLDASTESLLNDDDSNEKLGARKKKKKIFHFDNKENFPAHFREFIECCEQEIEESKNSVESGESQLKKSLLIGLIGVSMCIFGFYIGKNFITKQSNFS